MNIYKIYPFNGIEDEKLILIINSFEIVKEDIAQKILFLDNIACIYIADSQRELYNYLISNIDATKVKLFYSISDLNKDIFKYTIIAIGFKPLEDFFFENHKEIRNKLIIFIENISIFRTKWNNKFKNNLVLIESTITDFLNKNFCNENNQIINSIATDQYFENRGIEKDIHSRFLADNNRKICKIIGVEGIGKKSFIHELIRNYGFGTNLIQIDIGDRNCDLQEILYQFANILKIPYDNNEIKKIKLKTNSEIKNNFFINNLISAFDKLSNGKILFWNFHFLLNSNNQNKISNKQIAIFIDYLINRSSFKGNKVYFISNIDITFESVISQTYCETIKLKPFSPNHIVFILSKYYSEKGLNKHADEIKQSKEETIDCIISGHPIIAKLFVEASKNVNLAEFLNDSSLIEHFEISYKIRYLLEKIPITEIEFELLLCFCQFREGVSIDYNFVHKNFKTPLQTLELLIDKMFLEYDSIKGGYYIHSLIKNYILSLGKKEQYKEKFLEFNNIIGEYFFDKAENFHTPFSESDFYYRTSFYHFEKSHNLTKLQFLTIRYSNRFLKIARDLSYERPWESLKYYSLVYEFCEKFEQFDEIDIAIYLERIGIEEGKKNIESNKQKFELAFHRYGNSELIKTSHAKYLYLISEYDASLSLCMDLLRNNNQNHKINTLLPKIYAKQLQLDEALSSCRHWIETLLTIVKNKQKRDNLQILESELIHNLCNYIDFYSRKLEINKHLPALIEMCKVQEGIDSKIILSKSSNTSHHTEIINLFEKLIKLKYRNKKDISNYIHYLEQNTKDDSYIKKIRELLPDNDDKTNIIKKDDSVLDFEEEYSMFDNDIILEKKYNYSITEVKNLVVSYQNSKKELDELILKNLSHQQYLENIHVIRSIIKVYSMFENIDFFISIYIHFLEHQDYVVLVEGQTDSLYYHKAFSLFRPNAKIQIIYNDNGGVNWLHDQIIFYAHSDAMKEGKVKVVALFDNDAPARKIINELKKEPKILTLLNNKKLMLKYLNKPIHIIDFYKKGIFKESPHLKIDQSEKVDNFSFSVEHLFPEEHWVYASEQGWLEKIDDLRDILILTKLSSNETLEDYLSSKGITVNEKLYISHKIKWNCKTKMANYLTNLNDDVALDSFKNFKNVIDEICKFFGIYFI